MQGVTRKTISFPEDLARDIASEAANDRRAFSAQVVKILEDLFCGSNRLTVTKKRVKK
jgi:hypothetical protein